MSKKSPFAIQKALAGIGGEPKSVKRLRSGDLLIETNSALQTTSFLLAKSFLNSPLTISPYKTLNSCHGVISKPDLLTTPDAEILDGFPDQSVIQVRRIITKKDVTVIPTKHIILTFSRPSLPKIIKARYLNCKIRPYILNPLRCFKCQRMKGHRCTP
ncbi:RNA-directed DNA polymerase from mobile element jockey [Trichonephila clavipes]|nr:RNA-directed DNA polymerase from mobile element jockey [Trichonephila clavipes]